jgi:acetyltransferase-like isoleucine patch superfamily enzyme
MIRFICLYLSYLLRKVKDFGKVRYNGFTVVHSFAGSSIQIGKGTTFNSGSLSNLLGLYQRCIVVARHGGKIRIGENCGISGSTIYSMNSIDVGNEVLVGANCKIIDNDFHPLSCEQRTENREQRTENREQRTENREQRTENREQRTENREQRTENRVLF